ncbi:MAG: hypothetical protein ABIH23_07845 [bacterium]
MNPNCKKPRPDLLHYVEATTLGREGLSEEQCSEIATHMDKCDVCRSEVAQVQATLRAIGQSPSPEIPGNLAALVSDAIRSKKRRRTLFPGIVPAYASLAAILIGIVFFFFIYGAGKRTEPPSRTAQLNVLLEEQERWIIILANTLRETDSTDKEELNQAAGYVLSRLDRSTQAFREAAQRGGLDPELIPDYEERIRQQIDYLKEFYFEASSS